MRRRIQGPRQQKARAKQTRLRKGTPSSDYSEPPIPWTEKKRAAVAQGWNASLPAGKKQAPTAKTDERKLFEKYLLFLAYQLSHLGGNPLGALEKAVLKRLKDPRKAPLGRPRARKADRSTIETHLSEVAQLLNGGKTVPPFGRLSPDARHAVRLAYVGMLELEVRDGRPSSHPAIRAQLRWLALERERDSCRARGDGMPAKDYPIEVPSGNATVTVKTEAIERDVKLNAPWLRDK